MESVLLQLLSFLLFTTISSDSLVKSDRQQMNLKGAVKSIKEMEYKAVYEDEKILKGYSNRHIFGEKDFYIQFNSAGNKTEHIKYQVNGMVQQNMNYTYDDEGRLSQIENVVMKPPLHFISDYSYEFGASGQLNTMGIVTKEAKGKKFKVYAKETIHYSYNENQLLSEVAYHAAHIIVRPADTITKFTYIENKSELLIEKCTSYLDGLFYSATRYDNKGRQLELQREYYNPRIYVDEKEQFAYDAFGNVVEWTIYKNDNPYAVTDKVIEWDEYARKYFIVDTKLQVNQKNYQLHQKYKYVYGFDSHNNWIEKTVYATNQENAEMTPIAIVERTISYFD